jgi:hypothetical protein
MWLIERHSTLNATNYRAAPRSGAGELLHEPSRLFVFGFSDDRRLALIVWFGVVVVVLVIIIVIVGVSRRHRAAHNGDEAPLGRGKVLRDALGHVGSLLDVATLMRGCYRAGIVSTDPCRIFAG